MDQSLISVILDTVSRKQDHASVANVTCLMFVGMALKVLILQTSTQDHAVPPIGEIKKM